MSEQRANVLDGQAIAQKVRSEVRDEVSALTRQGIQPGLAVIIVGDDPASQVYVRNKGKQTIEAGMASFEHKLGRVTAPTLILFGEHDAVVPPANAELLASKLPNARVEILPYAGHFFPFETPQAANQVIADFLLGS